MVAKVKTVKLLNKHNILCILYIHFKMTIMELFNIPQN